MEIKIHPVIYIIFTTIIWTLGASILIALGLEIFHDGYYNFKSVVEGVLFISLPVMALVIFLEGQNDRSF